MKKYAKKSVLLLLVISMLVSMFSIGIVANATPSAVTISDLKIEELTDPLGVDIANPHFSWIIDSSARGTTQSAYQIIVYKGDTSGTVVWDTGKVLSSGSINVKYEGSALVSSTNYCWTIKVWDQAGNESDVSKPATFSTGKFDPASEFSAKWITYDSSSAAQVQYNPVKIKFDQPIKAQYLRFAVQKMGLSSTLGRYRNRIAEIEAYNSVEDPTYSKNLLFEKARTSQNMDNVSKVWDPKFICDGDRDSIKVPAGYQCRYAVNPDLEAESNWVGSTYTNGNLKNYNDWVNFNFGSQVTVDEVWIYPVVGNEAITDPTKIADFPVDFTLSMSNSSSLYGAKAVVGDTGTDLSTSWVMGKKVVGAPAPDNDAPKGNSLPLLAKSFDLTKTVKSATLYSSGLGIYEMRINGSKVSENVLEPGQTDFEKSIFYNTYDVTGLLNNGENVIGAMLGNGMFDNPRYALRYSKADRTNGSIKLFAQLEITYTDGTTDMVVSDDSWKWTNGPTVTSHWYGGEDYDARLELSGWDSSGYSYANWKNCVVESTMLRASDGAVIPMGTLKSRMYPGLQIVDTHETVKLYHPEENIYVFDLGVNFAGWFELSAALPAGTKLKMLPAEQFSSATQRVSQASYGEVPIFDTYIFKGDEKGETWHPNFMYHGFRWLEVVVIGDSKVELTADMVRGLDIRVANESVGKFETSNADVNGVHDIILRSAQNNMYDAYTDCPQREKLGWQEQSQLTYNALAFNYDIAAYMEKIAQDQREGQQANGLSPSIVPNVSPQSGNYNDDLSWGGATILVPFYTYQTYGDTQILQKSWDSMEKLMQHYADKRDTYKTTLNTAIAGNPSLSYADFNYVLYEYGLGDWGEYTGGEYGVKNITSISSNTSSSVLITTPVYAQLARTMSETAAVLGDADKAAEYKALYENIKAEFNGRFFDYETGIYNGPARESSSQREAFAKLKPYDNQSVYALALYNDLVPEDKVDLVVQNLVNNIVANDYHLNTGEVTLKQMITVLMEHGYNDVVYKMAMNDTMPSYKYFLGRTTSLPEHWNMSGSQSHIMMGLVERWFYEAIGGINNNGVAFDKITVNPYLPDNMTFANVSTKTKYGEVGSSWTKGADGTLENLTVTVPVNTTAEVYIQNASVITESGIAVGQSPDVKYLRTEGEKKVYRVGSGTYEFKRSANGAIAEALDPKTNQPITSVQTNGDFAVVITTPGNVDTVKLVNENEMSIGKKSTTYVKNADGTKTWTIISSVATAGSDRTLSVYTSVNGTYADSGASITLNITGAAPAIVSVTAAKTAVKNEAFTITVVTSKTIDKIKLTNETGATIGTLTSSSVIDGNTKTWTLTAKIGTAGDRFVNVLGAVKDGVYVDYDAGFDIVITK